MITFKEIYWKSELFDCVKALLAESFPPEERRDMSDFERILKTDDRFTIFVGEHDGELVGFITSWDFGTFAYVEHFAVSPVMRNHGCGTQVLKGWLEVKGKPVVLEVELPTDALTRRRVGFYERNGFVLHEDFEYLQPPYRLGDDELPLRLMTHGDCDLPLDVVAAIIKREVYDKQRNAK